MTNVNKGGHYYTISNNERKRVAESIFDKLIPYTQARLQGKTPKKKVGFRRSELNVVNIRQKPKVKKKEQVTAMTPALIWL